MNYQESPSILEKIKAAQNILINCHIHPDLDSISSAISLYKVVTSLGKSVQIISPDEINENYHFISETKKITINKLDKLDLSDFDLFLIPDSQSWKMLDLQEKPDIAAIAIDHHPNNEIGGIFNLLDVNASSTCEILVRLFQDWDIEITPDLATILLSGIIEDTGAFQQENTTARTLQTAGQLVENNADLINITFNVMRQFNFQMVKYWGEMISRTNMDEKHNFVWTAVPNEITNVYKLEGSATSSFTNLIMRRIKPANFCIAMNEKEPNVLNISFRSRVPGFNVSSIAKQLGGGGHKEAAGAQVLDKPFEEAVEYVLETARNFVKENEKGIN